MQRGCKVPFPQPGKVAEQIQIVTLEELISLKLDSWAGSPPVRRHRDKTDVIELIKYRKLPRDLAVNPAVRALYLETWDALAGGEIIFDCDKTFSLLRAFVHFHRLKL